MLYLNNVLAYFREHAPDKVTDAYNSIDYNELVANCLATLSVEEWDKQSPINGVSAYKVIQRRNDVATADSVYLIKGPDGRVLYLQPFVPGVEGFKPIHDPMEIGKQHAQTIAESKADSIMLQLIQRKLLGLA
jgi:hypothetical protein